MYYVLDTGPAQDLYKLWHSVKQTEEEKKIRLFQAMINPRKKIKQGHVSESAGSQ
jgi:hypothetical protein